MSNAQAIMYIEYMRDQWTEQGSPYWDALTQAIDALKEDEQDESDC